MTGVDSACSIHHISDVFYWDVYNILEKSEKYFLDLLNFKDMGYKCVVTNNIVNVASRIFKSIGQLLMGVLHFKDWRTQWHLAAIAVVLALEEYQNEIANNIRVRGVPVHIIFMPSGFIGVRCGDGDAKTIISHNTAFGDIITNTGNCLLCIYFMIKLICQYYCNAKIVHIHK